MSRRKQSRLASRFFSRRRRTRRKTRRAYQFEPLEARQLLAADLGPSIDDTPSLMSISEWMALTGAVGPSPVSGAEAEASNASAAEGENAPDLVAFAKALFAAGVKYFGADWCRFCTEQKQLFEDGGKFLQMIEVTNPDRSLNQVGIANNIQTFPTWVFPSGERATGVLTLADISQRSGVPIPQSSNPTFATLPNVTVLRGSPRYVPIDGYDPNGGPLTISVTSSNPSIISASVSPQTNRSLRMNISGYGEMVFQLLEDKVPRPVNRLVQLALSGFYNAASNTTPVTFHRVINGFVIQGGDPTGTGAGGSPLGNFDDQYHADAQHNQAGVLSFAKSSDDTNNSQFFITLAEQRRLDFNHSVSAIQTEGASVRAGIGRTSTDANDKPTNPVRIDTVSVIQDQENGLVLLKANATSGFADITVTITDAQGNTFSQTFRATAGTDTFNSAPFLEEIGVVRTTVNTPVNLNLHAVDVEGDPLFFDAIASGTTTFNVQVNRDTGAVTVTPPVGFVGKLEMLVGVRGATAADTVDQFDTQRVQIEVAPTAPTALDLLAESDTGESDSDNITSQPNAIIRVDGTVANATVQVFAGTTLVGSATANGSSVTVNVNLSNLADGPHVLTAKQLLNTVTSNSSPSLNVRLDRQAPQFTSAPPTVANIALPLTYNAQTPDEASGDVAYTLLNAPTGATVDDATGVVSWTPTAVQRGQHAFTIRASDAAGNFADQQLSINVQGEEVVRYRVQTTRLAGQAAVAFEVGEEFLAHVFVSDIRAQPRGVVSAFVDLLFPGNKVSVVGAIQFGSRFDRDRSGAVASGNLDEVGGMSELTDTGDQEFLLFTVRLRADQAGTQVIQTDPADVLPLHDTLLFDSVDAVPANKVLFGSANVSIFLPFTAVDDLFNVDEDSVTTVDVKANDIFTGTVTGPLRVSALGTPSQGGTVSIAADGRVRYQPKPDFFGVETFSYSVTDDVTGTAQATVTMQVHPTNDPPQAVNDAFTGTRAVLEDSQQNFLDVLANDSILPDVNETLKIVSVGARSHQGAVTISPTGSHLFYTPASNFFGTETFTYTIEDSSGSRVTATVSVEVKNVNDLPVPVNDVFTLNEDSDTTQFDVLANDHSGPDPAETLTIVSVAPVGAPSGTLTVTSDKKFVRYKPAANFFGQEVFKYVISDGNGGTAEGRVTFNVTNVNDPPNAVDDTGAARFQVTKNTVDNRLDVLRNDTAAPDVGEVLTVQSVTTGSAGGQIRVSTDGKAVVYTPRADFIGTETFQYTISDGNGGTDTATVEVESLNFIPSSLRGFVYVDANNNGLFDAGEQPLGGVLITLQGQDMFGQAVQKTATTAGNGAYEFLGLTPGNYTLREQQPAFLEDGRDTVGSQGGSLSANDTITVQLAQNVNGTGNNFGERGPQARYQGIRDLFASTPRQQMLLVVDTSAGLTQYSGGSSWSNFQATTAALTNNQSQWSISVRDPQQNQLSIVLPNRDSRLLQVLARDGSKTLLRILGSSSSLPFQTTNGSNGSGEGEASPITAATSAVPAVTPLHPVLPSPSQPTTSSSSSELPSAGEGESTFPSPSAIDQVMSLPILDRRTEIADELAQWLAAQATTQSTTTDQLWNDGQWLQSVLSLPGS
jgi:large repetitive protein